jgi:ribose transport system substrate-binding protein
VRPIPARSRSLLRGTTLTAMTAAALALAACSSSSTTTTSASSSSPAAKHLSIAYLSFAVENSYDAPMLAAAQAVAADNNATLKVFDANNSPQTQYSQLQDAINSGQYQGIIVQPIFGTGLTSLVKQAISKGIKVVNMDQILGPKPVHRPAAGPRAVGERRVRAHRDRHQARQPRGPGLQGQEPQPVQGGLPV